MRVAEYFPKKSIDVAKKVAKELKSKTKDKSKLKEKLIKYNDNGRKGFKESLKSKKLIRWPHEDKKGETSEDEFCAEFYVASQYLGLKPRIYEIINCRYFSKQLYCFHHQIYERKYLLTVQIGDRTEVFDPVNCFGGRIIKMTDNKIVTNENLERGARIEFDSIKEISDKEFAKRIRKTSSLEGKIEEISKTQHIETTKEQNNIYVSVVGKYDKDKNRIIFREDLNFIMPLYKNPARRVEYIFNLDEKGEVSEKRVRFIPYCNDIPDYSDRRIMYEDDSDLLCEHVKKFNSKYHDNRRFILSKGLITPDAYSEIILKRKHSAAIMKKLELDTKQINKERARLTREARKQFNTLIDEKFKGMMGAFRYIVKGAYIQKLREKARRNNPDGRIFPKEKIERYIVNTVRKFAKMDVINREFQEMGWLYFKKKYGRDKERFGFIKKEYTKKEYLKVDKKTRFYYERSMSLARSLVWQGTAVYKHIEDEILDKEANKIFGRNMNFDEMTRKAKRMKLDLFKEYVTIIANWASNAADSLQHIQCYRNYVKIIKPHLRKNGANNRHN